MAEIERLWDAPAKSSDADKLDILTLLVQHYESIHYPIADPDPHPLRMSESEEDLWLKFDTSHPLFRFPAVYG